MADFETLKTVKYWTQRCIPLVYDNSLSIYQLLEKVINELNKLITNNNMLPEYIANMIKEYISSGAIEQVVREILANYILNVKYPPSGITPAVGDGSQDDTAAVQGCIDYASEQGGGAVYLPYGAYSVQSLTLKSNVSLFGFDRYTTRVVLRGGATNSLILLNGSNAGIYNLTLDGNAGIQVNDINVVSMIAQDVLLNNLIIEDGYQLLVYNGTGGHLQMDNIVFGNAVQRCAGISGNSIVQAKNLKFTQLSAVSGIDIINIASDGGTYDFISNVSCETCLSISGNDNYVTGIESGATNAFIDSGLRNTIDFKGNERKEYYYGTSDTTIKGNVGFTTNGAYSENVSGAFTSVRNGTESKIVTGNSTEQYNSSQTENVTGKKTINAQDIYLNPTNPLQYKTPTEKNLYNTIPFKDASNTIYNLMVENDNTPNGTIVYADEGSDITTKLNNALQNGNVILLGTNYIISDTILIPDSTALYGNGVTLKVDNAFSGNVAIQVGETTTLDYISALTRLSDINIDCNVGKTNGVLVQAKTSIVNNVHVFESSNYGFSIFETSTYSPSDVNVINCSVNCSAVICNYGMIVNGTDNVVAFFRTTWTHIGIQCNVSGNFFYYCHPLGYLSNSPNWENSIGFNCAAVDQTLIACYADNFRTGVEISISGYFYINGLYCFWFEQNNTSITRYGININTGGAIFGEFTYRVVPQNGFINNTVNLNLPYYSYPYWTTFKAWDMSNIEPNNFNISNLSTSGLTHLRTILIDNDNISNGTDVLIGIISGAGGFNGKQNALDIITDEYTINGLTIIGSGSSITISNPGIIYPTTQQVTIKTKYDSTGSIYIFATAISDSYFTVNYNGGNFLRLPHLSNKISLPTLTDGPSYTYNQS